MTAPHFLDGKEFFSSKQAAHYLQKAESTLRRWRTKGSGPAYMRDGGTLSGCLLYYTKTQLDEYVKKTIVEVRPRCENCGKLV